MRIFLLLLTALLASGSAFGSEMNGGPVQLYDASGNGISSTTNWLNVDIQNASIPVSQSGTWNINNITGTVSLPTGASTSALQLAVQGSVSGGTAATASVLVGGQYNTALPVLTNGQQAAIQLNSSGQVETQVSQPLPSGTNVIGAVTQSGGPWTTNVTQVGGSALNLGQTTMANSVPVVLASNQSTIMTSPGNTTIATYVANVVSLNPATSPTDVLTITGSATKIVRIMSVRLLGSQTVGSVKEIDLVKRTTLDTGGTSTPVTPAQMDSGDSAATAVVTQYSANPSALGTSAGKIVANLVFVPDVVTQLFLEQYSNFGNQKPIILENANENLAVNLNASTMTGGALTFQIIWTEL